ncbi:type II inositol 3,4-bisphosphate 4-phosphatase-like [Stegastes partitus]|uniref:Type II inositol 3,4-bisphosphate 4-phosphatase-like n=1 Tax=Stegastes partitus TaxID=144197 RepID=A0A9Y4U209_9TELE|nr:PREDICTED: type II inositol 3,4-bisphosphate 4-phosphatase-like [Stegastes partitus]
MDGESPVDEDHVSRLQVENDQKTPEQKYPVLCDCLHASIHERENSPMMRAALCAQVCKLYRFQAESQRWLLVREQMSETPLSLSLPKQLLSMLIQEHTDRVQEVTELGDLSPHWDGLRRDVISHCHHLIGCYQETLAELDKLSASSCFKVSSAKSDRHLQFVPTNLHSQRMEVTNPDSSGVWYDVITFGAPADHHQAFKHGGLRRLLSKHTNHSSVFYSQDESSRARELLASVAQLQPLVFGLSEELLSVSLEVNVVQLQKVLDGLIQQTDQFVHTLKDELVKNALLAIHEQQTCSHADGNGLLCENLPANQEGPPSPGQADRRCDSEYDQEEWDRLWANVAKSLNCIIALVDRLRRQEDCLQEVTSREAPDRNSQNSSNVFLSAASSSWQEQLLPLVLTLRDCVREAVTLARAALTFVVLQGALSASAAQGPPSLVQRRHAVFSQALSAVTLGFLLRLHEGLKDPQFLLQLHSVGILVQLEGLLNPYGDELGMLEDTEQSVSDLSRAAFTFTQAPSQGPEGLLPSVRGAWGRFVVEVPLPPETFSLLPRELKDGCLIRVDAVLFNIGINQRSLAERFGDVSVQDRLNRQSFERLRSYCSALTARLPDLAGVRSLPDLLSSLDLSLQAKRRKKVEVLWIAATVCRQVNGVRLTSCKSAKDPTAMSVTLEQCLLLRRRHQLSRQSFSTALDSMRREGCRLDNMQQKVANRKFSLSSVRLLAFPKSKDLQTTTVLFSHVNLLFGCRCFSS